MAAVVWKYKLEWSKTEQGIVLPKGARFLSAQFQDPDLVLWAIVDPSEELEGRRILVVDTGQQRDWIGGLFLGTVVHPRTDHVVHVFVG